MEFNSVPNFTRVDSLGDRNYSKIRTRVIHLFNTSYLSILNTISRDSQTRTDDHMLPMHAFYQLNYIPFTRGFLLTFELLNQC